jgi:hypothetical protein
MTNTILMEGTKHDEGKLRWDLVPWEAIEEVVRVYTHGADKYGDNNWMGLEDAENRYFAALMRHLVAWRNGEHIDPDSGLKHLAQVAWNALALLWFTDRP